MIYVEKFRKIMNKARVENKLSKSELAKRVSKSPSFICDIESGRKNPSFETAINISNVLNISLDEIFKENLRLESNKDEEEINKNE